MDSYILTAGMGKSEMRDIIQLYNKTISEKVTSDSDSGSDYIYLKHGTNYENLLGILKNGLTGRKYNFNNNFKHAESSEDLIYLTDKWHYLYSFISVRNSYDSYLIERGFDPSLVEGTSDYNDLLLDYWEEYCNIPVVLTVKVSTSDLLIDEDIIYNRHFLKYLKQCGSLNLVDVGYEESLKQHTVACKRSIPVEDIIKVDLIGYFDILDIMANSEYGRSFSNWCNGFLDDYNVEDIYDLMVDNNLGGIDELDIELIRQGYDFKVMYEKDSSCILIKYFK